MEQISTHVFEQLLWFAPMTIATCALKFLRELSVSVRALNQNIALIVLRIDHHEKSITDHETRLREIEM